MRTTPLSQMNPRLIAPLVATPEWTLSLQKGAKRLHPKKSYSWPKKPDPNPIAFDSCSKAPLSPVESGAALSKED